MFVSQPEIPLPLAVKFPFPAWATRPSERGATVIGTPLGVPPDDPFEGLPEGPQGR
jgi:uncharacterized protein